MGGLGSGSWRGRSSRATVKSYHTVDVNQWHRLGYLQRDFPWVWTSTMAVFVRGANDTVLAVARPLVET